MVLTPIVVVLVKYLHVRSIQVRISYNNYDSDRFLYWDVHVYK